MRLIFGRIWRFHTTVKGQQNASSKYCHPCFFDGHRGLQTESDNNKAHGYCTATRSGEYHWRGTWWRWCGTDYSCQV